MKITRLDTWLEIEAEKGDVWCGKTFGIEIETIPPHGKMLRCGVVPMKASKEVILRIKLEGRPWLQSAVREWTENREKDRLQMEAKQKDDNTAEELLISDAKKGIPALLEQMPETAIRVEAVEDGWFDGDRSWKYVVSGTQLSWRDIVVIGTVSAIRPKAITSFWMEVVAYIFPEDLERIRLQTVAKEAEKRAEKENAEKRRAEIFEIARQTGKNQVLSTFSSDCCDDNESCNVDIITILALPDGTTTEESTHTW